MKFKYPLLVFILLFINCSSVHKKLITTGNQNDAVKVVISDFLKLKKALKNDVIYSIHLSDLSHNILGISIIASDNKLAPGPDIKIGKTSNFFPSRYIEKEGKLFYWSDSTYALTKEMVTKLSSYNLIDSMNVEKIVGMPKGMIDDSKKGVDYYICKSNFNKYKKRITRTAMGNYQPPIVNCD